MKKLIIAAICGLTCVAGGITAGVALNSPEYVLATSITEAVEDVFERDDISTIIDVLEQGSVAVDCEIEDYFEFGGKMYFGLEKSKLYIENANLTLNNFYEDGSNYSLSANMYLSEDMMYIENDKYLDGAYGIKLKNLSEQFRNSILYEDSEFSVPKEYRDMIENLLDYYENEYQDLQKDSEKLIKKYLKQAGKAIKKHGEFDSETKNVSLNDERSKKRVVTLKLDEDAIASIVEDLIDYVIDDKDLEKFIETHVGNLSEVMGDYISSESMDASDIYDQIINALEELEDEADSIRDLDFEVTIKAVTPKLTTKLLKLEVEVENNGYETSFEIDFGSKGVKKSECIEVSVDNDKIASYEVKENSKDKFQAEVALYGTYNNKTEKEFSVEYTLNKSGNKFSINVVDGEFEVLSIKGKAEIDGKATTFKVKECVVNEAREYYNYDLGTWVTDVESYDYLENIDLTITVSTKDKMPKPNKDFNNILEITEAKIRKIIEKFEEDEALDQLFNGPAKK